MNLEKYIRCQHKFDQCAEYLCQDRFESYDDRRISTRDGITRGSFRAEVDLAHIAFAFWAWGNTGLGKCIQVMTHER